LLILLLVILFTGYLRTWPLKLDVTSQQPGAVSVSTYAPPEKYEPRRDPEKDLLYLRLPRKREIQIAISLSLWVASGAGGATLWMNSSAIVQI
jgi:hypothetical protein